jgi:hypothetical protein
MAPMLSFMHTAIHTAMYTAMMAVAPCDPKPWQRAFDQYVTTYPEARAADLYKFAHHGIMGSEHAVHDTEPVRAYMTRELAKLAAGSITRTHPVADPLIEPLPPDNRFVRVHLRPYLERHGSPDALLEAFVRTANSARGDTSRFACAAQALADAPWLTAAQSTVALIARYRRSGFPAVHHSPDYEKAYGPAYRVLDAEQAATLVRGLAAPKSPQTAVRVVPGVRGAK